MLMATTVKLSVIEKDVRFQKYMPEG